MGYQQSCRGSLRLSVRKCNFGIRKNANRHFKEIIVASSIAQADMQENASSGSDDNDTLNEMESYIVIIIPPTTDGRQTLEEMAALYKKQLGEHPSERLERYTTQRFWKLSKGLAGATYSRTFRLLAQSRHMFLLNRKILLIILHSI